MKQTPISFIDEMVLAILDGSKTQTRRIANVGHYAIDKEIHGEEVASRELSHLINRCKYGKVGDQLWGCEAYGTEVRSYGGGTGLYFAYRASKPDAVYCRDCNGTAIPIKWIEPSHMPQHASRIKLEITSIRLERLQDISEADAKAEGAKGGHGSIPSYLYAATPIEHFKHIWESIYGEGSWEANPWVWVIDFKWVK